MTCKNCGAQLLIDQQKCPYCGTQNPEYIEQQHLKITRKSRQIVLLCVMAVLFLLSILFVANSWNIASAISDWHAAANSEKYCAMLDAYEEEGDYLCESLKYYYEYIEREPYEWYYEIGAYDERHVDAVECINRKIEDLLQFTFSMTDEELTEFRSFSFAEKQVFIERRFHEHE